MDSIFIEAKTGDGKSGRWVVRVIQAGLSGNGTVYPATTLREAVPLFEGVRVFVKGDEEHLAGKGKHVCNLIGRMVNARFVEADPGEIQADLELIEPESEIAVMMREAWDRGMTDLFGFSINAGGKVSLDRKQGRRVRVANSITKVDSVDLIVEPGAGGRVVNLIEAKGSSNVEHLTQEEITKLIEATKLPKATKTRLTNEFKDSTDCTEEILREAIGQEASYLAEITDSGTVKGLGDDSFPVRLVEGRPEKVEKMLDAFLDPQDKSVISLRECYLDITGDKNFTGLYKNCDEVRLRESLTSASFPDALGDSIARRMVTDYNTPSVFDVWRNLAKVLPVGDFRVQERTRIGGYGDLPKVAESASYDPLTSPTDEKATYQIEKRGGTEDLTMEMIANDDVGSVREIPNRLSKAAKRTLSKFVLDHLKDNPVIYDTITLFHASHGNLGTAALSGASVAAGRLAIKSQQEKDSNEKIGLGPKFLWVPDELEETAVDLFRRNTENDKTFVHSLSLEVVPVWYWTDINDWCLSVDPHEAAAIEVGFFAGQEEPELFIQDNPNFGSMFTNDKTTYKIRHIYGGTPIDYRPVYKGVVA